VKRHQPPARHLKKPSRDRTCSELFIKGAGLPGPLMNKLSAIWGSQMPTSGPLFEPRSLLAAPPLQEDKARADAEVLAAEGRARTVQERIGKCSILAPIDGTVLRVYARRGESFSTVTPRTLFSLADTSSRTSRRR